MEPVPEHEQNRRSWNAVTPAHNSHKRDQAAWLRAGGSTLYPEESALLGDIAGQRLAHLQCNCGQDSLSLARLGAQVTGVDISDAAIDTARQLSAGSGIPATFERADLFHWFQTAEAASFDVAFSSYGFIGWLSDLRPWAAGLRRVLRPGGRFVCVEFHPLAFIWDDQWRHAWPYSSHGAVVESGGVSDYVGMSGQALAPSGFDAGVTGFVNPHPTREYAWGVGDILGALLSAGLRIERFDEHAHSNGWKGWEPMRALPDDGESGRTRWTVPEGRPEIPLMFGLVARAP